jgi:hypothetical protein
MGRKKNLSPPVKVGITISPQMSNYLDELVARGIHGRTPAEVVFQLISREIQQLLKDGYLKLPKV